MVFQILSRYRDAYHFSLKNFNDVEKGPIFHMDTVDKSVYVQWNYQNMTSPARVK